jgi:hypothetical protein
MGDVVPFPLERARREENAASARPGGATILLFLGVRYERHRQDDVTLPPSAGLAPETGPARRKKARRRA